MTELEIFNFNHDQKRYGTKAALRIHAYRVDKEFLRTLPIADLFPLTIELAEAQFAKVKMSIFDIYLEYITSEPLDVIAKEYSASEKYIPRNNYYNPPALLMAALVNKLGDQKKLWEKAVVLFSDNENLSKLIAEKIAIRG